MMRRCLSNAASIQLKTTKSSKLRWQMSVAICVERPPVISPEMTPLEKNFSQLLSELELRNSLLSDHEVRHLQDQKVKSTKKKKGEEDEVKLQTAQDLEDMWNEEFKRFVPASRTTEADLKADMRSLNRSLDRKLLLVVKQKLGDSHTWMFPLTPLGSGETLRTAAERLSEEILSLSRPLVLGNSPCGVFAYRYAKPIKNETGSDGMKVFFYKANLSGKLKDFPITSEDKRIEDFMWLSNEQLSEHLSFYSYRHVKPFLM